MPASLPRLVRHSLDLIATNQSPSGAYVASPTFPTYHYSWFRDGAFIADAMSRHGRWQSADRFHEWCEGVVASRRDHVMWLVRAARRGVEVRPDEHLRTRYTVDGNEDDQPWENFQLDGYGTWLWALSLHRARHHDASLPADTAIVVEVLVDYLVTFWDEPSYDWWEEHLEHRHTSTVASIWAGLDAVAGWTAVDPGVCARARRTADRIADRIEHDGVRDGHLVKFLCGDQVDASLVACIVPFGLVEVHDAVADATIARIEQELVDGGVHRYPTDVYYGGGQWVLLAGFLGWYYVRAGNTRRARELLGWMVAQADEHLDLPEQVTDRLLAPDHLEPWRDKWGPSARPLLWSHAMLLDLVDALGDDAADIEVTTATGNHDKGKRMAADSGVTGTDAS